MPDSGGSRELREALRARGDAVRAQQDRAYLKSDMEHLGVPLPAMRALVKAYVKAHPELSHDELVTLARELWRPPVHEFRTVGALLLEARAEVLSAADAGLVEELVRRSGTWALVDVLAASVAGRVMVRDRALEPSLRAWGADEDMWVRRLGILGFLRALRTDAFAACFPVFGEVVDPVLEDRRFFVRKAIGWVLREVSKDHPDEVYEWALGRRPRMSGVTVRELVKHYDDERRGRLLRGGVAG
ncbi:DNA alkylation repair protein [Motilibacter aurantiacus]|uniref:DNA alkylation repair protein n=1 Tax=Motilibacter aurantiacus TaxID=2714955 RepID=UPI00140E739D|nr:DNA alkylation repair protein [Motilibacter aurantiacus]